MREVFNRSPHDPPRSYGDCFSAALSSITMVDVPHVLHDGCDGNEKNRRINGWMHDRSLAYVEVPVLATSTEAALEWAAFVMREAGIHYLLSGVTESGIGHYCVCYESFIVHNPSPGIEIVKPYDDGYFWVGFVSCRT